MSLLGLCACMKMGLDSFSKDMHQLGSADDHLSHQLQAEYSDFFSDDLGKLPVICSTRETCWSSRTSHSCGHEGQSESQTGQNAGTGSHHSSLRASRLGVIHGRNNKKDKQEIQIYVNRKDLSVASNRPHQLMRTVEEVATQMSGATVFSVFDAKSSFWQISLNHKFVANHIHSHSIWSICHAEVFQCSILLDIPAQLLLMMN